MVEKSYTIGEVAKITGVAGKNSSTLRLWTEMFADWLSPSTRPEKGQLRLYSEEDLRILQAIRDLRRHHIPYDEIRDKLARGAAGKDEGAGREGTEAASAGTSLVPGLGVEELRETMAPVLEVADDMRRFLREANLVMFRLEFARLTGAIEALDDRLIRVQREMESFAAAHSTFEAPISGSDADAGRHDEDTSQSSLSGSRPGGGRAGSAGRAAREPAWVSTSPVHGVAESDRAGEDDGSRHLTSSLNEYGLRPVPPGIAGHALGDLYLCQRCGSSSRPLGVTPTSRLVLACIECGRRNVVPLSQLEKALGISPGFWARLWRFVTKPFSRRSRM